MTARDAPRDGARPLALALWLALFALCLAWELWLAPLRSGGSWLALKALPLLLPLRGMLRGEPRSFQWALLLSLLYLGEAGVRLTDAGLGAVLAALELGLVVGFFACAVVYLRQFRQDPAARTRKAAAR
jgi:uncharacterized membrane protein